MQLTCPECRQNIPAEDVDLSTALAKCRRCQTVFSFQSIVQKQQARAPQFQLREPIDVPAAFHVDDWPSEFKVRWRWFRGLYLVLGIFCGFWDGFLVIWYAGAILGGAPWMFLVVPLLHVAVGVGLTYVVLGGLLNSSTLRLAGGELSIEYGPVPWKGGRRLAAREIEQLYCQYRANPSKGSQTTNVYDVHAILSDTSDIVLVSGLTEPLQALYLEQQFEQRLGIVDRAVDGEMPR